MECGWGKGGGGEGDDGGGKGEGEGVVGEFDEARAVGAGECLEVVAVVRWLGG